MAKFIGIDPGTLITGYAIVEVIDQKLHIIDYGCIRPPAKNPLADRYVIIYDAISELVEIHSPEALAVETQFVSKNVQSAIKLGMARGVTLIAVRKAKTEIAIFEYAPKKVKVAVTGNGNASKNQVQTMVQHYFRLPEPPMPFDAADALALTICHAHAVQTQQFVGVQL